MKRLHGARYPLAAVLLLLACQPALAAGADEEEEQEPLTARWSLAAATQVDQQSNRGAALAIGYAVAPTTAVRLSANSNAYSATQSNGFHSNGVEFAVGHDFSHISVSGALGTWQASDILTASEGKLGVDLRFKPWSIGLRGMYRRSSFDRVTVNQVITLPDGTMLPVANAVASCTLSNEGIGAHGEFAGEVWGAHATFMTYQYKNANCSYGKTTGLDALLHPSKDEFKQLESVLVAQLALIGVRPIGRENTLLSSEFNGGASWKRNDLIVALDFTRQAEYFTGGSSNTIAATGTADLGHNSGVDVTIGLTRGNTVVNGAFVGFGFRAHF